MSSNTETAGSTIDTVLWFLVVALLGGAIGAFYYFSGVLLVYRVAGLLLVLGLAATLGLQTSLGRQFWDVLRGAQTELRKVVWPNRQETMQTSLAVIAMVLLVAIFFWLLDMLLAWGVGLLTGIGV